MPKQDLGDGNPQNQSIELNQLILQNKPQPSNSETQLILIRELTNREVESANLQNQTKPTIIKPPEPQNTQEPKTKQNIHLTSSSLPNHQEDDSMTLQNQIVTELKNQLQSLNLNQRQMLRILSFSNKD